MTPIILAWLLLTAVADNRPLDYFFAGRFSLVRTGFFRRITASFGTPVLLTDLQLLLVGSAEGDVLAYQLPDYRLRWRLPVPGPLEGTLTRVNRPDGGGLLVIVPLHDGGIWALEPQTGQVIWRTRLAAETRAAVTAAADLLLVPSNQGSVAALRLNDGTVQWNTGKRSSNQKLALTGHGSVAVAENRVFVGQPDGTALALNLADGALVWQQQLTVEQPLLSDIDVDPIIMHDTVIFASYAGGLHALAQNNGELRWQLPLSLVTSTTWVGNTVLLVGTARGELIAVDPKNGQLLWRRQIASGPLSRGNLVGTDVVFTAGDAGLVIVAADSGRIRYRLTLPERLHNDVASDRQNIATIGSSGYLYFWWIR